MAGRKSAGVAPLGHRPLGKEKLEGPKVKHDFHGTTDSVPGKGMPVPMEHWERHYDATDASKNMKEVEGADFVPKKACDRKTTYVKVNELDH